MKALVIYDSLYGNTEQIARAIACALGSPQDVRIARVNGKYPEQKKEAELVVIGSPTQGFNATKPVQNFIKGISEDILKNVNVAVFDTRIAGKGTGAVARLVTRLGGYAAPRMAEAVKKKGGSLIAPPEGFAVKDTKGASSRRRARKGSRLGKGNCRS